MLENPNKFPLLPFPYHFEIEFLLLKPNSSSKNLSDNSSSKVSYESSETSECEVKCEDHFSNQDLILAKQYRSSFDLSCSSKTKSSVKLSEAAKNFQSAFYQQFTSRKKFQKKFVVMIHNEICTYLNLRRVNREEARSINLYFLHFLRHKDKILSYINNNSHSLRRRIQELNEIPK